MHAYLITGATESKRVEEAQKYCVHTQEIITVSPEKKYLIEDIRRLTRRLLLSPQDPEKGRVVLIEEAQNMTPDAANALLKTLEEPLGNTTLVLTAPQREQILETISSRTQHINLRTTKNSISQDDYAKAEKLYLKLTTASLGEKFTYVDSLTEREEAIEFCQNQLLVLLKKGREHPSSELISLVEHLQTTIEDLKANVNVKLCLTELILKYPNT